MSTYTVVETNSSERTTVIEDASWRDAYAEAAHIATSPGTEWREVYEGDDIVLRVDAGDDVELLDAWGVLGKRAATERWSLERCRRAIAGDAVDTWNFKSRAEIEAAASKNGHVVSETRENGGRGCVHAKAPHGCGRVEYTCSCGARAGRSLCGNDAVGAALVSAFDDHLWEASGLATG